MEPGIGVRTRRAKRIGDCARCGRKGVGLKCRRVCYRCMRAGYAPSAPKAPTAYGPEYEMGGHGYELRTLRLSGEEQIAERARRVEEYRRQVEEYGKIVRWGPAPETEVPVEVAKAKRRISLKEEDESDGDE